MPTTARASSLLALATALRTPLPRSRSPPSRSSTASSAPVEAPDGTIARPCAPLSSTTSTSTVGLPRESNTSRAHTRSITLTAEPPGWQPRRDDHDAASQPAAAPSCPRRPLVRADKDSPNTTQCQITPASPARDPPATQAHYTSCDTSPRHKPAPKRNHANPPTAQVASHAHDSRRCCGHPTRQRRRDISCTGASMSRARRLSNRAL